MVEELGLRQRGGKGGSPRRRQRPALSPVASGIQLSLASKIATYGSRKTATSKVEWFSQKNTFRICGFMWQMDHHRFHQDRDLKLGIRIGIHGATIGAFTAVRVHGNSASCKDP